MFTNRRYARKAVNPMVTAKVKTSVQLSGRVKRAKARRPKAAAKHRNSLDRMAFFECAFRGPEKVTIYTLLPVQLPNRH